MAGIPDPEPDPRPGELYKIIRRKILKAIPDGSRKRLLDICREAVGRYDVEPTRKEVAAEFERFGERLNDIADEQSQNDVSHETIEEALGRCGIIWICAPPSKP